MLQLVIAAVLIFVLMFGLGFILNMLLKTTWLPIYAFIILVIVLLYMNWESGGLWSNLTQYTYVDIIPTIGGLIGVILSGSAIRTLRAKGFRMF